MGQTVPNSNPGRGKTFLFSKILRTALDPPSLLLNGYRRQSGHNMKLTAHLHLLPRLRMTAAVPHLSLSAFMFWTGRNSAALLHSKRSHFTTMYKNWKRCCCLLCLTSWLNCSWVQVPVLKFLVASRITWRWALLIPENSIGWTSSWPLISTNPFSVRVTVAPLLPTCFWIRTSPAKNSSLSPIWTILCITCNTDITILNDRLAGCGLPTAWRFTLSFKL